MGASSSFVNIFDARKNQMKPNQVSVSVLAEFGPAQSQLVVILIFKTLIKTNIMHEQINQRRLSNKSINKCFKRENWYAHFTNSQTQDIWLHVVQIDVPYMLHNILN